MEVNRFYQTLYSVFQSGQPEQQLAVIQEFAKLSDIPSLLQYLSTIWFAAGMPPHFHTLDFSFFMQYVQLTVIDQNNSPLFINAFLGLLDQHPRYNNYITYSQFLEYFIPKITFDDKFTFLQKLQQYPSEVSLLPVCHFTVLNPSFSQQGYEYLTKQPFTPTWYEAASYFFLKAPHLDTDPVDVFSTVDLALSQSIGADFRLLLLSSVCSFFEKQLVVQLIRLHFLLLVEQLNPKSSQSGITAALRIFQQTKDSSLFKLIFAKIVPLVGKESEQEFLRSCQMVDSKTMISYICEVPVLPPVLYLVISELPIPSLFPNLFLPTSTNQKVQYESLIRLIKKKVFPADRIFELFAIFKEKDFILFDDFLVQKPELYCLSATKYLTRIIDSEKLNHIIANFEKYKLLPIIESEDLDRTILTLSSHFFLQNCSPGIACLLEYFEHCRLQDIKTFSFQPKPVPITLVHDLLQPRAAVLTTQALERVKKEEKLQAFALAAISQDPTIVQNSALLLAKDLNLLPKFFIAAASNRPDWCYTSMIGLLKDQRPLMTSLWFSSEDYITTRSPIIHECIIATSSYVCYCKEMVDVLLLTNKADKMFLPAVIAVCSRCEKKFDLTRIIEIILDLECPLKQWDEAMSIALLNTKRIDKKLAVSVLEKWFSMISKKDIPIAKFEEAFVSPHLVEVTKSVYAKRVEKNLSKEEENVGLLYSLGRVIDQHLFGTDNLKHFFTIFILNTLSLNDAIRNISFHGLELLEGFFMSPPKEKTTEYEVKNYFRLFYRRLLAQHSLESGKALILYLLFLFDKCSSEQKERAAIIIHDVFEAFGKELLKTDLNPLLQIFSKSAGFVQEEFCLIFEELSRVDLSAMFVNLIEGPDFPLVLLSRILRSSPNFADLLTMYLIDAGRTDPNKVNPKHLFKAASFLDICETSPKTTMARLSVGSIAFNQPQKYPEIQKEYFGKYHSFFEFVEGCCHYLRRQSPEFVSEVSTLSEQIWPKYEYATMYINSLSLVRKYNSSQLQKVLQNMAKSSNISAAEIQKIFKILISLITEDNILALGRTPTNVILAAVRGDCPDVLLKTLSFVDASVLKETRKELQQYILANQWTKFELLRVLMDKMAFAKFFSDFGSVFADGIFSGHIDDIRPFIGNYPELQQKLGDEAFLEFGYKCFDSFKKSGCQKVDEFLRMYTIMKQINGPTKRINFQQFEDKIVAEMKRRNVTDSVHLVELLVSCIR